MHPVSPGGPLRRTLAITAFVLLATTMFAPADALAARREMPTLPYEGVLPVELHLGQQELVIEAQNTNAMAAGGGLIGAVIASAIDNSATQEG